MGGPSKDMGPGSLSCKVGIALVKTETGSEDEAEGAIGYQEVSFLCPTRELREGSPGIF